MAVTITLDLPNELERELSQAAARLGMPLADYALRVLAADRSVVAGPTPMTGAELVAYWEREGVIGFRADIEDPVKFARKLREQAQNRIRD
jgi:hypothetical protein